MWRKLPSAWGVGQVHFVQNCTMLEQMSERKSQGQQRSLACHGLSGSGKRFSLRLSQKIYSKTLVFARLNPIFNIILWLVPAWKVTWTELWERSTIIPSRFISFISVWKVFVRTGRMTHWIHLWTYQVLQPFVSLGGLLKINSLEIMMDHLKWLYRVCFGLPPPKFQVWKT